MSFGLRAMLFLFSAASCYYVIRKIKKAQIKIEDSIFWILFWIGIVLLSIFPNIIAIPVQMLKVDSPANLIYLIFIFILLIRVFAISVKMSQLENKIKELAQRTAINDKISREGERNN